jgi:hypothetical protein
MRIEEFRSGAVVDQRWVAVRSVPRSWAADGQRVGPKRRQDDTTKMAGKTVRSERKKVGAREEEGGRLAERRHQRGRALLGLTTLLSGEFLLSGIRIWGWGGGGGAGDGARGGGGAGGGVGVVRRWRGRRHHAGWWISVGYDSA